MNQSHTNVKEMSKNQLQRMVTENFLNTIDDIVNSGKYVDLQNEAAISKIIAKEQGYISKLKKDDKRYVSLEMITLLVNLLGANSNNIFLLEKSEKEKLFREGVTANQVRKGNTNNISDNKGNVVQGAIINGDNYKGNANTTLKIINGLPAKDRKEMKEYLASIQNQNSEQISEIEALKKIIDRHKEEIDKKEKELSAMLKKYIGLLESHVGVKK